MVPRGLFVNLAVWGALAIGLPGCFLIPDVAPAALFSATPMSGTVPLTVEFADLSFAGTAPITEWAWNFGDGSRSTKQHPKHTYTQPGDYTVSLTVTTEVGFDMVTSTRLIHAKLGPTAAFTSDLTAGPSPLTVAFQDQSEPGGSAITDWRWNFGDGGWSLEQNPSYTYLFPGTYSVSLTVFTDHGDDTVVETDLVEVRSPMNVLVVSNGSYDFALNEAPWSFQVWNAHPEDMGLAEFAIESNQAWLTCSPASGSSTGPEDRQEVVVSVDRTGLTNGQYEGVVTIWGYNIETKRVTIQMTVDEPEVVTDWYIQDVRPNHGAPYLVEYAFALRDEEEQPLVAEPAQFEVACFENGTPISSETDAHFAEGARKQLLTYLVLDYTSSMADTRLNGDADGDGRSDAIEAMEAAAKDVFLDALNSDAQTGIYEFHRADREPAEVAEFTTDRDYLKGRIDAIWDEYVQNFPAESRCWDALYAAVSEFADGAAGDERRTLVVLSDGHDESSTHTYEEVVAAAVAREITIYCIGFGAEADSGVLKAVAEGTGGAYFGADAVAELGAQFGQIVEALGGQYVLRWATLRRTSEAFTPSFSLTLGSRTAAHTALEAYVPTDYAGDPVAGRLRLAASSDSDSTTVMVRALYVPRYITRLSLRFESTYAFAVSLAEAAEGGLCGDWTLTTDDASEPGAVWVHIVSPDPESLLSAMPYASFGPVLRLEFDGVVAELDSLFESAPRADNSLYEAGQYFEVE